MYCIKRTVNSTISYLTYDGWRVFKKPPLDLSGVLLFTKGEMLANAKTLPNNQLFQYYGSYKR